MDGKTWGIGNLLENNQGRMRGAMFKQVVDDIFRNRIFDARYEDIWFGFHKPEFHPSTDGGGQVFRNDDDHVISAVLECRQLPFAGGLCSARVCGTPH